MAHELRSRTITDGVQRSPNRAMLRAVGFGDRDFGKPIVGVANAYSTITPCNVGLDRLAKRAEAALRGAPVSQAAFEDATVKSDLFRRLDVACAPAAILASNTSSISITKLAAATSRPAQVVGLHFMNPVPVMGYVELIRGLRTSDETMDRTRELAVRALSGRKGPWSCSRWSGGHARARARAAACSPPIPCPRSSKRWG